MANRKINVTDLDFDQIKNNLKEYLRGQSEFTDYEFEGSALSTLLDVLAYNTHYQGLYYNLVVNEAFLDSASKRSSVISKAHELGYMPKTITSSKAMIDITMVNSQLSASELIELPKYTPFTTSIDGVTYTFYTTENHIAYRNNSIYSFKNVEIKEGYPLTYQYNISNENTKTIIIPNVDVDSSTIKVVVQDNPETVDFVTFVQSDTILNVDGQSNVFFLKELSSGQLQLQFGNGSIGKALVPGNLVTVEYFVSKGAIANGARSFAYNGIALSNTTINVVTINPSFGGSYSESIEEIRFNAPKFYTTQNRCITVEDYKSTIKSLYPIVRSVNVWGGEDNNPPRYGEVFISPINVEGEPLSNSEKEFLLSNVINPRKPITTKITFVDPDFIDLALNVTFYYDSKNTTKTAMDLSSIVKDSILRYNNDYLNQFDGIFRYSKLANIIDDSDISIINNIFTIKSYVSIKPIYGKNASYQIDFKNPIHKPLAPEESILSDGFVISTNDNLCYIDDVPDANTNSGTLRLFYLQNNIKMVVNSNIGTIDYTSGMIYINDLNIISSIKPTITFAIKTESNDIASTNNKLVRISERQLVISAVPQSNLSQYQFTSSRT